LEQATALKFKGEPKLRFDILEEVAKRLPGFPIVLHGASSVIPEYVDMINKYGGQMPGAMVCLKKC
jgi:fructose-bisphosphate aldolase class II